MWKIVNTSMDRSKALLHRTAPKLEMEPMIGGNRLRMQQITAITDHQHELNKEQLERLVRSGVITMEKVSDDKPKPVKAEPPKAVAPALAEPKVEAKPAPEEDPKVEVKSETHEERPMSNKWVKGSKK